MGFWNSVKTFLDPDDGYEEMDEEMYEEELQSNVQDYRRTPSNVVSFQQAQQHKKLSKVFVMEPTVYTEAERVADALLKGEAVIINFRKMEVSDAKRVIDFVVGVTYAINGDVQQIREDIYICSPPNFQVQGSFVEDEYSSY